jgi:hypothetical protein
MILIGYLEIMKVIKIGYNPDWPIKLTCTKCNSILLIGKGDVHPPFDEGECPHVYCPVCGMCLCVK